MSDIFTEILGLFKQTVPLNTLLIFQHDFINHLDPEDLDYLSTLDKCLISLLCHCFDRFKASLVTRLNEFRAGDMITRFTSETFFEETVKDINQACWLIDVVSEYGTVHMLEWLSGTAVGALLKCSDNLKRYSFGSNFAGLPALNREFLITNRIKCYSSQSFCAAFRHPYFQGPNICAKLLQLLKLCDLPEPHFLLAECLF